MKHTFQVPSRKVSLKTDEYLRLLVKVLMLTGCQIVTHRRFIKDIQAVQASATYALWTTHGKRGRIRDLRLKRRIQSPRYATMSVLTGAASPQAIDSSVCRVMSLGSVVAFIRNVSVSLMLVNLTSDPLALITGVKLISKQRMLRKFRPFRIVSCHYITIARGVGYSALYLFSPFHLILRPGRRPGVPGVITQKNAPVRKKRTKIFPDRLSIPGGFKLWQLIIATVLQMTYALQTWQ